MAQSVPGYISTAVQAARSVEDLRTVAQRFLDDLGFCKSVYNFGRQYSKTHIDSVVTVFSDYPPEWRSHYEAAGYVQSDPVHTKSLNSSMPFTWRSLQNAEIPSGAAKIFNEAREFRLYDGITIPIRSDGNLFSLLTAVADGTEREQTYRLTQCAGVLMVFTALLHERAVQLMPIQGSHTPDYKSLSERETEVLKWIASGKTSQDISDILNVAESTVDKHIERIMQKLGSTSRTHAAVKGVMAGLIDPV